MGSLAESLVRNCLLIPSGYGQAEVREDCGDIVIRYPGPGGGTVRRSRRGASGTIYIPMEDGREVAMDVRKLFG